MASHLIVHHGNDANTPIITGFPFAADIDLSDGAVLTDGAGNERWAQAVPLTGSMVNGERWWELSFLSAFEGEVAVEPCRKPAGGPPLAEVTSHGIAMSNGKVSVELHTNTSESAMALRWPGGSGTFTPSVTTANFGFCVEEPGNKTRQVRILRNGPVRAQVEMMGTLQGTGSGSLDYRLTVDLWQEHEALRVDWMLMHICPGLPEITITRAALQGDWDVGERTERVFRQGAYGLAWLPRDVVNHAPVTLMADDTMFGVHVTEPTMMLDDTEYPHYCAPPVIQTGEWLELRGEKARLTAKLVDFPNTQPNALTSECNDLTYQMVPPGQSLTWCQGWRKEQTLLLAMTTGDDEISPSALAGVADGMFAMNRAQPTPATLRELKCFDLDSIIAYTPGAHLRISGLLNQLCQLVSRATKFDLGDTPDWHYTRGYATSANQYMPLGGFKEFPRATSHTGYLSPDPLKYFVEPVWTNNEYDVIHTMATEVMRTGKDDHRRMLRWVARHNVEIDFISYSDDPWHHRASPFHSHFHNRKGAITSHFWTQGLLQYYCLTGDRDALETARALGEKIIEVNNDAEVRTWKFDREIGWALLALCCLVESGETDFLDEARTIASFLQAYDRTAFEGAVNLSLGKAGQTLERQMIDNGFGYSSMIEALDRYQNLAGDEASLAWFTQLLYDLKDAFWEKIEEGEAVSIRSMTGLTMAIGYERTGDEDFLLAGRLILERWLDPNQSGGADISMSAGTEGGQVKPCAMAYRGLHRLLGVLDRQGKLDIYEYPSLREHRAKRNNG